MIILIIVDDLTYFYEQYRIQKNSLYYNYDQLIKKYDIFIPYCTNCFYSFR